MIRKNPHGGYDVKSADGTKNLGHVSNKHDAHVRLGQVEWFKEHSGNASHRSLTPHHAERPNLTKRSGG